MTLKSSLSGARKEKPYSEANVRDSVKESPVIMNIKSTVVEQYVGTLASLDQLSGSDRSMVFFRHGTLTVQLYAPRGNDGQHPHAKDEIYVIARGTGKLKREQEEVPFGPGDILFVPAGEQHKFVDFSDDFATWVLFYGPDGGEENNES